jgi:hypothetical protein
MVRKTMHFRLVLPLNLGHGGWDLPSLSSVECCGRYDLIIALGGIIVTILMGKGSGISWTGE